MIKTEAAERRRGRPRSTDKDDAILEAATRLFMERGFEAVSMDAIAEAAGVAKVTIYVRYPDKETLFRAVLAHKCEAIVTPTLLDCRPGRDTPAALADFGIQFLALILSEDAMNMHRIIMAEGARAPRISELFMEAAVDRIHSQLADFFREESCAGRLAVRPGEEERLAWRFLGAVKGHPHMRAMMSLPPMPPAEIEQHVRACVDDLMRAHGTAR